METKFQTSFIPKSPLSSGGGAIADLGVSPSRPKRAPSIMLDIAIFIFVVSIGAAGGMYAWKSYVLSQQDAYKKQLGERQNAFDPKLIEKLKKVNTKIDAASSLLSHHIALSNIFDVIGNLTIENVRFVSLDVSVPMDKTNDIKITLAGYGTSLKAIAFQSDVLADLSKLQLKNIVKNPILSDPSSNETGMIAFGFSATVNGDALLYSKTLSGTPVDDSILTASSTGSTNQ